MLQIRYTNRFKKDIKTLKHNPSLHNKLQFVVQKLANGEVLDVLYKDHALHGNLIWHRECHIEPDTLLIYKQDHNELVLILVRFGSHSKLF